MRIRILQFSNGFCAKLERVKKKALLEVDLTLKALIKLFETTTFRNKAQD